MVIDGGVELGDPPRILAHQIVRAVDRPQPRVGEPWVGWMCGTCEPCACASGHESLCPQAQFTGCDIDGGMAQYAVADERFAVLVP